MWPCAGGRPRYARGGGRHAATHGQERPRPRRTQFEVRPHASGRWRGACLRGVADAARGRATRVGAPQKACERAVSNVPPTPDVFVRSGGRLLTRGQLTRRAVGAVRSNTNTARVPCALRRRPGGGPAAHGPAARRMRGRYAVRGPRARRVGDMRKNSRRAHTRVENCSGLVARGCGLTCGCD